MTDPDLPAGGPAHVHAVLSAVVERRDVAAHVGGHLVDALIDLSVLVVGDDVLERPPVSADQADLGEIVSGLRSDVAEAILTGSGAEYLITLGHVGRHLAAATEDLAGHPCARLTALYTPAEQLAELAR